MVVEKFSQNLINTGVFKVYIAVGFFATLIFFIFNTELFSPLQMLFGAVLVTVALKGMSNFMLSHIINHFSLEQKKLDFEEKYSEDKIGLLLNQLVVKDIDDENGETNEVSVTEEHEDSSEEKVAQ